MDKSVDIPGGKEYTARTVTVDSFKEQARMVMDRVTGELYDPDVRFQQLLQEPWFQIQLARMRLRDQGYKDVTLEEPQEFKQVLVTDGEEFRVLHREEGSWAFTVSPCDRSKMKWWKELK